MALDLTNLAPKPGAGLAPRVVNRTPVDRGPNPFLDEGWLRKSYEEQKDYEVTVDGAFEEGTVKKGPNKGQTTTVLTGDAYTVTRMLRAAADRLGLGVTIQYSIPTRKVKGVETEIPGKVTVHYMGKKRKQSKKNAVQQTNAEQK